MVEMPENWKIRMLWKKGVFNSSYSKYSTRKQAIPWKKEFKKINVELYRNYDRENMSYEAGGLQSI